MARRHRPARRDYYDDGYYPRRRRGVLAPLQDFFQNVLTFLLIGIGAIVFFVVALFIAFNLSLFIQILIYIFFIAVGLGIIALAYLVVRMCTAISHRISSASAARSAAKIEQERVNQARVRIQMEQAKLARYEQPPEEVYYEPRRTRNFQGEGAYRTRVLAQRAEYIEPEPEPEPSSPLELLGMPKKGQVFSYSDYSRGLKKGQIIVGIRADRTPRIGQWQEFKILFILGSSNSGKSTTTLEKILCIVDDGGQIVICDPGGFKPDSLIQRIGPLQNALMPGTSLAIEHEEVMQNLEMYRQELERRRRGSDISTSILLVVDELNGLLLDKTIKKDLVDLMEKFGQQARGYNMYIVLCAQRASSPGMAAIRNSVISYMVHKCPEMEAEKILPAQYAKLAPRLGVGQTFVSDINGEIQALQQTYITPEDIAARAPRQRQKSTTQHLQRPTRQFGAPAMQQQRGPRKTNLLQASPDPQSQTSQIIPRNNLVAGSVWGQEEDQQPQAPRRSPTAPLRQSQAPRRLPTAPLQQHGTTWGDDDEPLVRLIQPKRQMETEPLDTEPLGPPVPQQKPADPFQKPADPFNALARERRKK